mgnify:CR=1 FL=1
MARATGDARRAQHLLEAAAAGLGVAPADCIGVEDAVAGIAAIHAAGMAAVGIGDERVLAGADLVLPEISRLRLDELVEA